jgi:Putative prokaryotic signal transducing protein
MADRNPHDVVKLVTAQNPSQAHIWQNALADAGIRAKVVGDFLEAGFGDMTGAKPEIWVHRDDVARAEEVLRGGEAVSDTDVEEDEGSA